MNPMKVISLKALLMAIVVAGWAGVANAQIYTPPPVTDPILFWTTVGNSFFRMSRPRRTSYLTIPHGPRSRSRTRGTTSTARMAAVTITGASAGTGGIDTVDGSYTNHQIFLKFDGANIVADVYVNGVFLGEHQGGFSAFVFDVTPYINVGADNVIAVKMNNAFNADIPPLNADFTFFGGIYRDVHLLVTDKLHITPLDYGSPGVYLQQTSVSSNSANLQVTTKLRNDSAGSSNIMLTTVIVDATNNVVATLTTNQVLNARQRSGRCPVHDHCQPPPLERSGRSLPLSGIHPGQRRHHEQRPRPAAPRLPLFQRRHQ